MRIALIVPGFSASEGDWCIPALLDFGRRLAALQDVEVFALRYPHDARSYTIGRARVHALGGARVRGWRKLQLLRSVTAAVTAVHHARPFDVIHGMWADEAGFVATLAGRRTRRPAVVSLMGGELVRFDALSYGSQRSAVARLLVGRALRDAALVTAGSAQLAESIPSTLRSRTRVVPLGVDATRFRAHEGDGGFFHRNRPFGDGGSATGRICHVLHVASLTPIKDHLTAIAAMRDLITDVPAHLNLVGDGPLRSMLEHEVRTAGLADLVTFHGNVAHDELPRFYQSADMCLVSSRHESQSLAALEACASGRPVVGTAVGILPELEGAAVTVPPGDAAGLATAMRRLAREPERRGAMGRAGRALVERRFSIDLTVAAMCGAYRDVIDARSHGRSRHA